MENASKALLISGTILIVLLFIAIGIRLFNSTQGTADQVEGSMQTTEIATFNSKFTQYVGSNKSKAEAISLLKEVMVNNSSTSKHRVYISFMRDGTIIGAIYTVDIISDVIKGNRYQANFANKDKFKIEVNYDNEGYINLIRMF